MHKVNLNGFKSNYFMQLHGLASNSFVWLHGFLIKRSTDVLPSKNQAQYKDFKHVHS